MPLRVLCSCEREREKSIRQLLAVSVGVAQVLSKMAQRNDRSVED